MATLYETLGGKDAVNAAVSAVSPLDGVPDDAVKRGQAEVDCTRFFYSPPGRVHLGDATAAASRLFDSGLDGRHSALVRRDDSRRRRAP